MTAASRICSLDHLVRPRQHVRRNRQADLLGSFQVDDQLELRGLLYWEIGGLGVFEDFINEGCRAPLVIKEVWPIAHEAPSLDKITRGVHRRYPVLGCEVEDQCSVSSQERAWDRS